MRKYHEHFYLVSLVLAESFPHIDARNDRSVEQVNLTVGPKGEKGNQGSTGPIGGKGMTGIPGTRGLQGKLVQRVTTYNSLHRVSYKGVGNWEFPFKESFE